MKRYWLMLVAAVAVADEAALTLDPAVMDAAKRAVFNGEPVMMPGKSEVALAPQGVAARWQEAMDAAGTEMMPVLLLALLQELNPEKPMAAHATLYAEALQLHRLAAAGNRAAREQLAAALRSGLLPNGLRFFYGAGCSSLLSD